MQKLEEELADLTAKFEAALAEKLACQAEEEKTSQAIDLANRLVNGLASENSRWKETVSEYGLAIFMFISHSIRSGIYQFEQSLKCRLLRYMDEFHGSNIMLLFIE